jgi:hypothetical protein
VDIRAQLPVSLRSRLDSLGGLVNAIVSAREDRQHGSQSIQTPRAVKNDIALLVFIFSLRRLLSEGTRAAKLATQELKLLGVPGFEVGSEQFEEGNENVLRGQRLANEMWEAIADPLLKRVLDSETSITRLIETLHDFYTDPGTLDRYR